MWKSIEIQCFPINCLGEFRPARPLKCFDRSSWMVVGWKRGIELGIAKYDHLGPSRLKYKYVYKYIHDYILVCMVYTVYIYTYEFITVNSRAIYDINRITDVYNIRFFFSINNTFQQGQSSGINVQRRLGGAEVQS